MSNIRALVAAYGAAVAHRKATPRTYPQLIKPADPRIALSDEQLAFNREARQTPSNLADRAEQEALLALAKETGLSELQLHRLIYSQARDEYGAEVFGGPYPEAFIDIVVRVIEQAAFATA